MRNHLHEIVDNVINLALSIQQIPGPTFYEAQRSAYVHKKFISIGLKNVDTDHIGNVYGRLAGTGDRAPVIVSAHLDTVFPIESNLDCIQKANEICGPAIGDNSLGIAALFGVVSLLEQHSVLPGDVWLVANTCEEGLGNLRGMQAVVDRFGNRVSAYIVVEGMGLGRIIHRGLGVQRYRVSMFTQGGHSWANFGRASAVQELARFVSQLETLELPYEPRTTYNVGVFEGGTSVNVIPSEAHLELDLRSEEKEALTKLCDMVISLAGAFKREDSDYVNVKVETIGQRPVGEIPEDHPLVVNSKRILQSYSISPMLGIGSTDANIPLSRGIPAVCLGVTTGKDSHTIDECIQIEPIGTGLQQVADVVYSAFT